MTDLTNLRWRTGRKVGRTIYAMPHDEARDDDPLIGVMDTPALAQEAIVSHNVQLGERGLLRAS